MNFIYNDVNIEYTIEYRKRKTIELKIEPTGIVRVRVPKNSNEDDIKKIIFSKKDWIVNKLEKMFSLGKKLEKRDYKTGEYFLFLNNSLKLVIFYRDIKKINIVIFENELILTCPNNFDSNDISNFIEKFYKKELKKIIEKRVKFYQSYFKVKPRKITIKSQKTKWGSCSSERNINFNWKLVMAPIEVIDYLVVHEMSHLIHMNHSKSFWHLVGKIIPDYKDKQEWLRNNGHLLSLDFKLVEV